MAIQLHINLSLNRPPDRTWRRPPGRPRNKWLDQLYETIPPVRLETSGGVLSTVDMVVQRRDGPRRLRDRDDDNDECMQPHWNTCVQNRLSINRPRFAAASYARKQ